MPEKFLLLDRRMVEDSDLTSAAMTNETSSAPATNLLLPYPGDLAVASGLTGELSITVKLDNRDGDELRALALLYTNLGNGTTWRADTAATEAELDSGPTTLFTAHDPFAYAGSSTGQKGSRWPYSHIFIHDTHASWDDTGSGPSSTPSLWLRIYIAPAGLKYPQGYTGAPYFQAGILLPGQPWEPPYDVMPGFKQRPVERSSRGRLFAGGQIVRPARRMKMASYSFDFMTRAQALEAGEDFERNVGTGSPVLIIRDATDDYAYREMAYGYAQGSDRVHSGPDTFTRSIAVEEVY